MASNNTEQMTGLERVLRDPACQLFVRVGGLITARMEGEHDDVEPDETCEALTGVRHVACQAKAVTDEYQLRSRHFRPFGKLDPDDPFDQAFVKAWNKGAEKAAERRKET